MSRLVVGIGMSSAATGAEVRALVGDVLGQAGVGLRAVVLVATRQRFVDDDRARLGPPVLGIADADLLRSHPVPAPTAGRFGALVAEGCALAGAGAGAELVVGTTRSAHATAALAAAPGESGRWS